MTIGFLLDVTPYNMVYGFRRLGRHPGPISSVAHLSETVVLIYQTARRHIPAQRQHNHRSTSTLTIETQFTIPHSELHASFLITGRPPVFINSLPSLPLPFYTCPSSLNMASSTGPFFTSVFCGATNRSAT
jgi:hypothetical protein